jgi:hypothetical protein
LAWSFLAKCIEPDFFIFNEPIDKPSQHIKDLAKKDHANIYYTDKYILAWSFLAKSLICCDGLSMGSLKIKKSGSILFR